MDLKVGLIGGSGLGATFAKSAQGGESSTRHEDIETPFGRPSDAIVETTIAGVPVLMLSRHGQGHLLPPSQVPYRANIFALKQLGCTHILASGAAGSLREEFQPRHLVIPDGVIDKTQKRDGTFFEKAAVHVEFAEPFCPVLRKIILDAAKAGPGNASATPQDNANNSTPAALSAPSDVHDRGCYVAMEGPAFSTRAESLMHRIWGGDLVGMTAMPEAKLAREAEIPYALIALVTDYDSWRQKPAVIAQPPANAPIPALEADPHLLLKEIIANLDAATQRAAALIRRTIELMAVRAEELAKCPARDALKLAIWSDKSRIDPETRRLLSPLWIKYFES